MDFTHLHVHSDGSLLDSACTPESLLAQARTLGMTTLALTDSNALYRAVEFFRLAPSFGIRPILGTELSAYVNEPDLFPAGMLLLVENETGYANLLRLINAAHLDRSPLRPPQVSLGQILSCAEGLHLLVGNRDSILAPYLLAEHWPEARALMTSLRESFGNRLHLELNGCGDPGETSLSRNVLLLAEALDIPLVAGGDVHYLKPEDQPLHEILSSVRTLTRLGQPHRAKKSSPRRHLRSPQEMAQDFAWKPELLRNACALADRLRFSFPPFPLRLPHSGRTTGEEIALLRCVCAERFPSRYSESDAGARERLEFELGWIERLGYAGYFLLVFDLVEEAKRRGIAVFGRGSAASSLVSYLLGITMVEPLREGLLFERFLNPARTDDPPDIDLDMDWNRRDELMGYMRAKYGEDNIVHVGGLTTFRLQGALRETGKALGKPKQEIDRFQDGLPFRSDSTVLNREWLTVAKRLVGLLHTLTTHPCGFVIARGPVRQELPLALAPEGTVTQYDMYALARLGFLKMDFLGSRNLGIIQETLQVLNQPGNRLPGAPACQEEIPVDDGETWRMIARGETLGCFQLESNGMRALLRKLRPQTLSDLTAALSLYRPGPIEGGMVPTYVRRHHGQEPVSYLHPLLQSVLEETHGVVLYQEQVMGIAREIGGFSLAEADILRKAMGEKDRPAIRALEEPFLLGARAQRVPENTARQIFALLEKFAGYGFNKAHSASYAIVAYRTAYLKRYFPRQFFAALLTTRMGYFPPYVYVEEARRFQVPVFLPEINHSVSYCTVEEDAVRLGFSYLQHLGPGQVDAIERLRPSAGFASLEEVCLLLWPTLDRRGLESLIQAGALDALAPSRSALLAALPLALRKAKQKPSLFPATASNGATPNVTPFTDPEKHHLSWKMTGVFVPCNPLELFRPLLEPYSPDGSARLEAAAPGTLLRAAALLVHWRLEKTKGGDRMAFLALEDLCGQWEAVLFPPAVERFAPLLRTRAVLLLEGIVNERQREKSLTVRDLSCWADPLGSSSVSRPRSAPVLH
jgi:DNA polymerase-3 subunit alpha